jgi:Glycosyl hydrolase family 26
VKAARIAALAFTPVAVAVVLLMAQFRQPGPPPVSPSTIARGRHRSTGAVVGQVSKCVRPDTARRYVGVVLYRPQQRTLPQFTKLTGVQPSIIEYYVDFHSSLDMVRAALIYRASALPVVQIDPYDTSLRAIAQGHYDAYLRAQAHAVARFHCPIAVSFGHEMNGNWYSWGFTHVSPVAFITAWRHIWHVFDSGGARNVLWTWTVNRVAPPAATPLRRWWPGGRYVDWVGIDGYYRGPRYKFANIFGETLREVRSITHDPVLLTETAVTRKGRQAALIRDLFRGARSSGLSGVVWFNVNASQPWTLAGRPPPAIAEFRKEADWFTR